MTDKKIKKQISQAKCGMTYPAVINPELVGTYDSLACSGGGYVWDEVLEYRIWCDPERGAPDVDDGNDYYSFQEKHLLGAGEWWDRFLTCPITSTVSNGTG